MLMNKLYEVMENWDTYSQALYRCQGSAALEGELSSPLCRCSVAGRSCICFEDLYIWKRWKMCFHCDLYSLHCTAYYHQHHYFMSCIMHPFPPTIHYICRVMVLPDLFWLVLISNFLPMLCCSSPRGWNPTCNRVCHQPATPVWSSSSCLAGSQEHSGIHSRSWFWPSWFR